MAKDRARDPKRVYSRVFGEDMIAETASPEGHRVFASYKKGTSTKEAGEETAKHVSGRQNQKVEFYPEKDL